MAKRGRKSNLAHITTEKVVARHNERIRQAAALAGVPEQQRSSGCLELQQVPQIGNEPTPIKETVRVLTRVEQLARDGVLEPHQAAACEFYALQYEIAYVAGQCPTANYDGGGSGGGRHVFDHCATHEKMADARLFMEIARDLIPQAYRPIFDGVIISHERLPKVAAAASAFGRTKATADAKKVLRFCADLIFDRFKAILPIDAPRPAPPANDAGAAAARPAPAKQAKPVSQALHLKLDDAMLSGVTVAEIHVAESTAAALEAEGYKDRFCEIPIVVREGWRWTMILVPATAAQAA